MQTEDQETCVQLTSDLATTPAMIVRGIEAIERDRQTAAGPMSDRLLSEMVEAVRGAVQLPWMVGEAQGAPVLRHQDWTSERNVTISDATLEIVEHAEGDFSWVACATGSGATRMGLKLQFRPGLPHFPTICASGSGSAKRSAELGFIPVDDGSAIMLPIKLNTEDLALAFDSGDFQAALAPLVQAVEKAVSAKSELDRLINLVRKRGKAG